MSGALILGSVNGLSYALLAVGLVLVFKASRVVNIAHAQMGVIPALLLAKFVLDHEVSYWVALPLAIALGGLIGAAVERWVVRRLAHRSRISVLLATIGLAQVLLGLSMFSFVEPDVERMVIEGYPLPFDVQLVIDQFVIRGNHLLILLVVPTVVVGLVILFRYTLTGKAIRAVAGNLSLARTSGISATRIATIAWVLAGAISAITAILQAPSLSTFDVPALGPPLLLRALGAAAIGGLTSLPWAFGAGLGLGLAEALTLHATRNGGTAELVLFLLILIGFFARSRAIDAASGDHDDPLVLDERPTRIPARLAGRPLIRHHQALLTIAAVAVAVAAPHWPILSGANAHFLMTLVVVYAIVGVSLTLLTGWAGQVSLGQFALLGVGAYVAARLLPEGWSFAGTMLAAGLVGAGIAVLVGLPALRLRGLTLAVTTLGFAVVAVAWLFPQPWFGGAGNLSIPAPTMLGLGSLRTQLNMYYAALATLVLVVLAAGALRRSSPGRLLIGVRDNEPGIAAAGFAPTAIKTTAFALSGFIAAVAGVLWAGAWRNTAPSLFTPEQSLLILAVPVIGGLGSLWGPALGALFVFGLPFAFEDLLRDVFPNTVEFAILLSGLGLLATQLHFPGGFVGALRSVWGRMLARMEASLPSEPAEGDLPALAVRDLSMRFGGLTALEGVSIEVHPGEIVGLIGANGAGKTTLLNCVAGTLTPASGSIEVDGHDLVGLAPEHRAHFGLGRSFQDARLYPSLTVREAIQVSLARTRRIGFLAAAVGAPWVRFTERELRARTDELIARLGLEHWADTPTGELSTGTRRVCDLALQVAAGPRTLLLDEPTAGIAQREAEAFGPLLRRIRDELDCSILIVEHDMPLILNLADRIYCLEAGRVIAEGEPQDVRADPRVIASYLGRQAQPLASSNGEREQHPSTGAPQEVH